MNSFLAQNISICDATIKIYSDHVSLENTTLLFSIPPSVGPAGPYYGISIQLFQDDGSRYSVDLASNIFDLSSATGNWSQSQLADYVLSSPYTIPCSSFACVKDCSDMVWTGPGMLGSGEESNYTVYRDCVKKCPGVTIPLVQGEAAAITTTSLEPSLITYTNGAEQTINEFTSRSAHACPAITSLQTSATTSSSLSTTLKTTTAAVASTTKSSNAIRFSIKWIGAWNFALHPISIVALLFGAS